MCFPVTDVELKRLKDAFKRTSGLTCYMTQQCFYREVLGDGVPLKVAEVSPGEHLVAVRRGGVDPVDGAAAGIGTRASELIRPAANLKLLRPLNDMTAPFQRGENGTCIEMNGCFFFLAQ